MCAHWRPKICTKIQVYAAHANTQVSKNRWWMSLGFVLVSSVYISNRPWIPVGLCKRVPATHEYSGKCQTVAWIRVFLCEVDGCVCYLWTKDCKHLCANVHLIASTSVWNCVCYAWMWIYKAPLCHTSARHSWTTEKVPKCKCTWISACKIS